MTSITMFSGQLRIFFNNIAKDIYNIVGVQKILCFFFSSGPSNQQFQFSYFFTIQNYVLL